MSLLTLWQCVQVYLSYPNAAVDPTVPAKVLRYFKKTCATGNSQETTTMSFTMTDRDVSCDLHYVPTSVCLHCSDGGGYFVRVLELGLELGCEREAMEGHLGQVRCLGWFVIAGHSVDWLTHRGVIDCSFSNCCSVRDRSLGSQVSSDCSNRLNN